MRFLVGLGGVLFFILGIAYFFYGLQPVATESELVQFKIVKGEGLRAIGARLSQQRLIKSISMFKLYSLVSGKAHKLQPGLYELAPSFSLPQIVEILTTSGRDEVIVTIPEGYTVKDIENILATAQVLKRDSLIDYPFKTLVNEYPFLIEASSLEGFLFPDTYRFKVDSEAREVVERMLKNFQIRAWPEFRETKNWYEVLILASFLEREVPEFSDRQIVAGILQKRLKRGMPLQVDATVSYGKCKGKFLGCQDISVKREDLGFSSTYNTYTRLGLTPTPIANPGLAAIKAALSPQVSPYLYYLSAVKTKETIFSKTLEEHNIKRARYL